MINKVIKKTINKKPKDSLNKVFYPKSIAVIGASNNISKIGGYIFSQIKNLKNIKSYPINTKSHSIQKNKSYLNIRAIGKSVDLAIIIIPSKFVLNAIEDCIIAKVRNIIIISAGFKEVSAEGKLAEEKIKLLVKKHNLNIIGPNCLGILNSEINLNCSFAKDIPKFGNTALISQSGAVIDGIIDWSFKSNVGFSKVISLGNMAGLDELEILKYLGEDKKTDSIVFYMETLEKGAEFGKLLKKISKKKPVIIIKPGKSENAQKAIGSHTGSLAQNSVLVESLIKENNGILVNSLNELFNILVALKSKPNKNNKIAILTNAGGPGVISTDVLEKTNFELFDFNQSQKNKLKKNLPKEASVNNPIDILGDAKSDRYVSTIKTLSNNSSIGNIFVLLTPQIMTDCKNISQNLIEISKKSKKNIFSCFLGDKEISSSLENFNKNNFPNYLTPNDALIAQDYLLKYKSFKYETKSKIKFNEKKINKVKEKLKSKFGLLDYDLAKELLWSLEIKMPKKIILKTKDDINLKEIKKNKSYVLKADGKDLIHKKDVGGVITGINRDNFIEKSTSMFKTLSKLKKEFVITIEEEVIGNETIIGLKSEGDLGNFIMFGMGGTYVNVIEDVNFLPCPLNFENAKKIVEKSKVNKILQGFRGSKKINYDKLFELLVRISYLQIYFPEIKEVDLNPVICNQNNVYLVDVKLII